MTRNLSLIALMALVESGSACHGTPARGASGAAPDAEASDAAARIDGFGVGSGLRLDAGSGTDGTAQSITPDGSGPGDAAVLSADTGGPVACVPSSFQSTPVNVRTDPPVAGDPALVCPRSPPGVSCAELPASTALPARCKPVVLASERLLIVMGGTPGGRSGCGQSEAGAPLRDGAVYDAATGTWSAIPANGTAAFGKFTVLVGRRIVDLAAPAQFDLDTRRWTASARPSPLLAAGFYPAAFVVGSQVIVFADQDTIPGIKPNARAWLYDPGRDTVTDMAPFPLGDRDSAAHASVGGRFLVWGGRGKTDGRALGDGAIYDPIANQWTTLPAQGAPTPLPRPWAVADERRGRIFIYGDRNAAPEPSRGDGAIYDLMTRTWTPVPPGFPRPAATPLFAALAWDGKMVLSRADTPVVDLYDADTGRWRTLDRTSCNKPSLHADPLAFYKGKLLIGDAEHSLRGLALLDVVTGEAIDLDGALAPVARTGAAIAWLGDRLAVWGGQHYRQVCFGAQPASCSASGQLFDNGLTLTW